MGLLLWFLLAVTEWTPAHDGRLTTYLQGTFVSCFDADDGDYGERAYEHRQGGKVRWTFHMGPRDEFALFAGPLPTIHVEHNDSSNRLRPAYHAGDVRTVSGGRTWTDSDLNVRVNIHAIGGSDPDCYTFVVLVERAFERRMAEW